MKNILRLITVFLVCAFVASCQKDFENTLDPVIPPVTPQDTLTIIDKLIYLDPDISATDTEFVYLFNYDTLKRVTVIYGYDYENGISSLLEVSSFYYNGNNNAPFKRVQEEINNPYIDTIFSFYDNLQRLIKDSSSFQNSNNSRRSTSIQEYEYFDSIIVETDTYYDNDNPPFVSSSSDTAFIGSTGNIAKTVSIPPFNNPAVTINITYDNHPNPFSQINIYKASSRVPDIHFDATDLVEKNNPVTEIVQDLLFPGSVAKTIFNYTYNASGWPATVKTSNDDGQTFYEEIVFVYKKM